ncbi:MAG: hypothetical protein M5R36_16160 [Deltaproteobacteria bacterium]|nr:hypothetical protein [Deltaproteobacteria bacterium]
MRKLLVWTWILTSAFVACASDEDGGDSAGDGGVDDDFSDDDAAADDDSGTDDDDGGDHDVDASNGDWTDSRSTYRSATS